MIIFVTFKPYLVGIYFDFTQFSISNVDEIPNVPIGWSIADTKVLLTQTNSNIEVEVGTVGEICVSGSLIHSEYFSSPHLPKGKFVEISDQTFFKTGDFGKIIDCSLETNSKGSEMKTIPILLFCGRIDRQIQIFGERIEMVCFHLTFLSRREKEILKVDVRNGHDH
jgi:non-ribosomal peptide synthetase component F